MELKTQALDRVLEALSPALAAELDRVVKETREALEEDFQKRLHGAVRDAEAMAKSAAEQLGRSIEETRETTRNQVTMELEKQFTKTLQETTEKLQSESSAERERLQEQLDQWRIFAETQQQLVESSSQSEILARFLRLTEPFAAGLAIYVAKADGLALWKDRGKTFPEIISQETTDPEFYFRTISVRGRTVAAIYAAQPYKAEALAFMTACLERAIEIFGLKLRAPGFRPAIVSEKTVTSAPVAASAPDAGTNDPSRLGAAYPGATNS
jgi:hypothetical protein